MDDAVISVIGSMCVFQSWKSLRVVSKHFSTLSWKTWRNEDTCIELWLDGRNFIDWLLRFKEEDGHAFSSAQKLLREVRQKVLLSIHRGVPCALISSMYEGKVDVYWAGAARCMPKIPVKVSVNVPNACTDVATFCMACWRCSNISILRGYSEDNHEYGTIPGVGDYYSKTSLVQFTLAVKHQSRNIQDIQNVCLPESLAKILRKHVPGVLRMSWDDTCLNMRNLRIFLRTPMPSCYYIEVCDRICFLDYLHGIENLPNAKVCCLPYDTTYRDLLALVSLAQPIHYVALMLHRVVMAFPLKFLFDSENELIPLCVSATWIQFRLALLHTRSSSQLKRAYERGLRILLLMYCPDDFVVMCEGVLVATTYQMSSIIGNLIYSCTTPSLEDMCRENDCECILQHEDASYFLDSFLEDEASYPMYCSETLALLSWMSSPEAPSIRKRREMARLARCIETIRERRRLYREEVVV